VWFSTLAVQQHKNDLDGKCGSHRRLRSLRSSNPFKKQERRSQMTNSKRTGEAKSINAHQLHLLDNPELTLSKREYFPFLKGK
jgi:hypothetical protein